MKNTCGLYGTTISGLKRSQPATISEKDLSFLNKVIMVAFSMGKHHQINSWHQEGKKKKKSFKRLRISIYFGTDFLILLSSVIILSTLQLFSLLLKQYLLVGSGIKTVIASWKKGW